MFDRFGEMESAAEINELAANLKTEGDYDSIKALAVENGIDEEVACAFIDGFLPMLCDDMMAAIGKLKIEAEEVKAEELISDWCEYIKQRCLEDEQMQKARDEIIYRNKNWHEWHDRYAAEIDRKELKNKNRKENKEYKNISIDYKLNKALFSWEDDNYIILVPKNAGEINEEGRKQHHCVGAQSQYKDKMNRRQTFIVFLRKKEDPKKPYYTIECDLKKVLQFYAAYDRQPDKERAYS